MSDTRPLPGPAKWRVAILPHLLLLFFGATEHLVAQQVEMAEYAARRHSLMQALPDGLILLHARSGPKEEDQPGWVQNASFFYFTGMANVPEAILLLDAPRREALLFVPPVPRFFGMPMPQLLVKPGAETAAAYQFNAVIPWDQFSSYVQARLQEEVRHLYLDDARYGEAGGMPENFAPVSGGKTLWKHSIARAFPQAELLSAEPQIRRLRWTKSAAEIAILQGNATATAAALIAGIKRIRPGISQRQAEVAVVGGCMDNGAQGPSFWPWVMSGPNAVFQRTLGSFYDYQHLDRVMQAGELVRVDVGCGGSGYGGDVGRTVPVSGVFSGQQRIIWELLVAGYRGGLAAMKAGNSTAAVIAAAQDALAQQAGAEEAAGHAAAAAREMLQQTGGVYWHLHGVGIASGEAPLDTLQEGSVIAFEPMFSRQGEGYYLEDMILITASGYQILSAGLPYSAGEIEQLMKQ